MTAQRSNILLNHPAPNSTTDLTSTDGAMPQKNLNIQAILETKMEADGLTSKYRHEIIEIGHKGLAYDMGLKKGDILSEFMGVPLHFFGHKDLVYTLKNFNQLNLDILVYRKTENLEDPILGIKEECIRFKITLKTTNDGKVIAEKLDCTERQVITFDFLDGIVFYGPNQIALQHIKTGHYLKLDGGDVWLAPNYKKDEASFRFMCLTFSGMDEPEGVSTRIMMLCQKEIFLRLQENYEATETPMVTSEPGKPPPIDAKRIEEDPRLFVVKPIEGDESTRVQLASFMNKDLYLSIDPKRSEEDRTKVCFAKLTNTLDDYFTVFQLHDLDDDKKLSFQ